MFSPQPLLATAINRHGVVVLLHGVTLIYGLGWWIDSDPEKKGKNELGVRVVGWVWEK